MIAFDNADGARELYGASVPRLPDREALLVVGNERRGISPAVRAAADHRLFLPMPGRAGVDSLNVAAAAAVGLFWLSRESIPEMASHRHPERRRPPIVLVGPTDHAEAGSAIRSAAALGWRDVSLVDRHQVWFDAPRAARTEGRAAARWHRNRIRVMRGEPDDLAPERLVMVRTDQGTPIQRVNLARADQILVIPDPADPEQMAAIDARYPAGGHVDGVAVVRARIGLPVPGITLRYRALVTIALAEAARQIGRPSRHPEHRTERGPTRQKWRYRARTGRGVALRERLIEELELRDLLAY